MKLIYPSISFALPEVPVRILVYDCSLSQYHNWVHSS